MGDRALAVGVLLVLAVAGCGGGQAPADAASSPAPSVAASLDERGLRGCRNVALMVKEDSWDTAVYHLVGAMAAASADTSIAAAGDHMVKAAIMAGSGEPEPDEREALAAAQRELLEICQAMLGDEPW
jgi:hypothetical protein